MQARTIDVPKDIPKRSIQQYMYTEAERLEKRFRTGIDESENTVHKYLDAVSAVLQDAAKNDILLYHPAHRVEKVRVEKPQQRIPQQWEMRKLLQCLCSIVYSI